MYFLVVTYADAAGHLAEGHHLLGCVGGEGRVAGGGREGVGLGCAVCVAVAVCGGRAEYVGVD